MSCFFVGEPSMDSMDRMDKEGLSRAAIGAARISKCQRTWLYEQSHVAAPNGWRNLESSFGCGEFEFQFCENADFQQVIPCPAAAILGFLSKTCAKISFGHLKSTCY